MSEDPGRPSSPAYVGSVCVGGKVVHAAKLTLGISSTSISTFCYLLTVSATDQPVSGDPSM